MERKPRANERLQLVTGALRVTLLGDAAGMLEGDVCNLSAGGAGIHLPTDRLPSLRVNDETILTFHRPGEQLHLMTRAVLRHSIATDGAMHYGFEFVQPERLRNQFKGELRPLLCTLFNARGAVRTELDPAQPLSANLSASRPAVEALVRVANLSASGMAVAVQPDQLPLFQENERVTIVFPNPADGRPLRLSCIPRGQRDYAGQRLLGLEFDAQLTEDFEAKRQAIAESCVKLQSDYLTRAAG